MDWEYLLQITYCNSIETLKLTERLCNQAIEDGIEGDFAEAGVGHGGQCIVMNSIGRKVWMFDSFEGIPKYGAEDKEFTESWGATDGNPRETSGITVCHLEDVKEKLLKFGPLSNYEFIKGWFCDTLPLVKDAKFSVLRLDCDIYHSYRDCLKYLYPLLQTGGWLIIDDYHLSGCKKALKEVGLKDFQFHNKIAYKQKP